MPAAIAEAIAVMTTCIAMGSLILIGFRMRLNHRERMAQLEAGAHEDGNDDAIEALQQKVTTLTEEMAELNERVDFAERLLTQGRNRNAEQRGVTTPV